MRQVHTCDSTQHMSALRRATRPPSGSNGPHCGVGPRPTIKPSRRVLGQAGLLKRLLGIFTDGAMPEPAAPAVGGALAVSFKQDNGAGQKVDKAQYDARFVAPPQGVRSRTPVR